MSNALHISESGGLVLTAAEVAKLLQISERHLWACHSSGRLGPRPISLGRAKRWHFAELRAWLAAGAPSRELWDATQASAIADSAMGVMRG